MVFQGDELATLEESHNKEINDAAREATPQTMTVALVRLEPVPPPEDLPGIVKMLPRQSMAFSG